MNARARPLMLPLLSCAALVALTATLVTPSRFAAAAPTPGQGTSPFAQQPTRGDVRDLSPLPRTPREYSENERSNDGIFAPPPEDPDLLTANEKKTKTPAPARGTPVQAVTAAQASPRSEFERSIDRMDIYYNLFFNGPSLDGEQETTWNRFGPAALSISHALDFDYHFDRKNLVGLEIAGSQTLVPWVSPMFPDSDPTDPSFTLFNPQFWYKRNGLIDAQTFSLDTRISLFPSMTDYSVNVMGSIAAAALDTTWNLKLADRSWTAYFTTRIKPTFYTDIYREDVFNPEWLYLSAGYYLGYHFTPSWQLNVSGVFDCSYYANQMQFLNRSDNAADFAQLELNYFLGRFARIGAYVQGGVIEPSTSKAAAGLDVTVNFL
jgi:hypothetical protein